ncbi:MAG: A24 family peptidase [Phycisphaerae bacterium]|nr:A24 family peptidase [Phycisphaerae bacterium]
MSTIETVWWLLFFAAVGLCVGSFLNVVIYRIPLGLSIGRPVWSFCPHCQARIRWYDNLPLVSYLCLRARARCCGGSISPRYPLIEVATAILLVVLLDAFFIGRVRSGLDDMAVGLSWQLAGDWPIYLAHVVLFACLLAMSAIDIEHYWIDTLFALFAVVAGCLLHTLWTPDYSFARLSGGETLQAGWLRPADGTAVACLAAFFGMIVVGVVELLRPQPEETATDADALTEAVQEVPGPGPQEAAGAMVSVMVPEPAPAAPPSVDLPVETAETAPPDQLPPVGPLRGWLLAWMLAGFLAVLIVAGAKANASDDPARHAWLRYGLPLLGYFGLILVVGAVRRPADVQIIEAIDSERPQARRMVLRELARLLPSIVLACAALLVYLHFEPGRRWMRAVLHWSPTAAGQWQPVFGLATAAAGLVVAAGIGWAVRIGGTLVFGREAFGDGDIHLMGAAGCVAGWPVVALGFVITCLIALAGWVLLLPFKQSRAIPLVPWLSLAFLGTVVFLNPLVEFQPVRNLIELVELLGLGAKS